MQGMEWGALMVPSMMARSHVCVCFNGISGLPT
jgi:hypothetical protein